MAKEGTSSSYLGEEKLGHLMVRLAIPTIVAQLANLLYSIVDRIYLGHMPSMGAEALTGLGVCMPVVILISSFALLPAAGGSPLASMALGEGNKERARGIVLTSELMLLFFTIILMAVMYIFMHPLLLLFGASQTTLPFAVSYLRIYLIGTAFVMISTGMSLFLLAQGKSTQTLISTGTGAVLHVGLAALFIFCFDWGIAGAAASSVISQAVSAVLVIWYLRQPDSALKFEFKLVKPQAKMLRRICSVGSGRFFIVASESLLLIVINATLQTHGGDVYVGAMTVLASLQNVAFAPAQGFTQGVQPIVSYCYGADNIKRVKAASLRLVVASTLIQAIITGLIIFFDAQCVAIFTDDAQIAQLAQSYIPLFFFGMLFFGLQLGLQSVFMGLGYGMCSLTVAFFRKIVLFIPLVFILANFYGAHGVICAEPISDIASVCFCTILFLCIIPKALRKKQASIE